MNPLKRIYDFIVQTNYDLLPEKSIETAKLAYLDTLAVSIAGVKAPDMELLMKEIKTNSESLDVLADLMTLNERDFALAFGTLSHVLDYDDVNFTFHGHPSVALIPAILTFAKYQKKLTGRELILAYIIGFEVQARIGEDIGDKQYNRGLHVTSTLGIFGAAASLTKLMNLTYEQFLHLYGMCVSFSSGVRKNFGTMTKPLHVGIMTENVIMFAKLVRGGFTGNLESFSEPMSYQEITTDELSDLPSLDKLGNVWESEEFGIIVKLYPCCAYTHRSIDAVIEMKNESDIKANEVISVVAKVNPKVMKVLIYPEATTGGEGKFSMQYCLSSALLDEKVNLNTFEDDAVMRLEHQKLMKKISMTPDEEQIGVNKELYAKVLIETTKGTFEKQIEFPLGHPYNPLPKKIMEGKVEDCIGGVFSVDQIQHMYQVCEHLIDYESTELLSIFE